MIDSSSPYIASVRPEVHSSLPRGATRFLDVGCNDGSFGSWLKGQDPRISVVGVEPNERQADIADRLLDGVIRGTYPEALSRVEGQFDVVTFNHVLEHIVDPWEALRVTKDVLASTGCIVALIPNVRYLSLIWNLAVRGRWTYTDTGLLDRTHLRFFTRSSAIAMFHECGYEVLQVEPVNAMGSVRYPRISVLVRRVIGDLAFGGFVYRAAPRGSSTDCVLR